MSAAAPPEGARSAPRIPLLRDEQLGPAELVEAIRRRRRGELLDLDRLLLHSPPIAEGWNLLMGNIRRELPLDARLRELAICAVALLNGAHYEFQHHREPFLAAGGTPAQLQALPALLDDAEALARSPLFDARERAVLALTRSSTREVAVDEACFAAARRALDEDPRALFELVSTVAAYNMVSRILVAFELHG